ncbi:hypothetical protein [Cedecea neteri]|uniref:hypothetical protein n=1 Tax=Cedecea neteri TaxID=158822 RepID=UPI0010FEA7F4|nr:hypothetical protein [Cedecea neteri]
MSPALIAPGDDPTQAGLSCREQRKRAIVGNESRTTPNVWVMAGGFTASAAMSSPGARVAREMALSPWRVHRALNEQGKLIYG